MKFLIIAGIVLGYFLISGILSKTIERFGNNKGIVHSRIYYTRKLITISLSMLTILLVFVSLGIEYSQLSVFLSSVFAVIGVALFAQWSILSNITASLIIFFGFPYRVGDRIRILDDDVNIEGEVEEISLFHVILKNEQGIIVYPNSIILQKPVLRMNPKREPSSKRINTDQQKTEA